MRSLAAAALLALAATAAQAADQQYRTGLDPVAFDNSTRATVVGSGTVTAALSGNTLTVSGSYSDLASAATGAHVDLGLAMGVPGPAIGALAVTGGTSGTLSGSIALTPAQVAGLQKGGVSVVVDSVQAPAGNVWGWLRPVEGS